ncbi:hypothetical protein BKA56DRAFT_582217 [Ilyonectria sp. MPI-CAGE-AT-0026]|nr:hypothetical protein BKA56DRAFT_582217 [Ilyonectria sp. MPI-CAGE-AT-0026]
MVLGACAWCWALGAVASPSPTHCQYEYVRALPLEAPFALLVQVSFSCRSAVLLLNQRRSASHDCRGCDMFSTLFPHPSIHPSLFMRVTTAL